MVTRKEDTDAPITDAVSAEISALRADLAELGGMVARMGKQRAVGLKAAAERTAADGYAKGEQALDMALTELQSLEDELAAATRRRPFASLGLAALVGFLFGFLARR